MKDFDKRFNRTRWFIGFVWILMIVMTISGIGLIIALINNPEAIGNFLGRITKAFVEAAK